jgi:hypothetical protein
MHEMNDSILHIELQYFAPVICYSTLRSYKHVDFRLCVPYRKASFRNRCLISGANGVIALSVPILGGRGLKADYQEVRIDHGIPWRRRHFQSIRSSYGKSPFFGHFEEGLSRLYVRRMDWLVEWNMACMDWVDQAFGVATARPGGEGLAEPSVIVDWTDRVGPGNYCSSELGPFPVYPQVFEEKQGFKPNLSVLDFVMNMGRASLEIVSWKA